MNIRSRSKRPAPATGAVLGRQVVLDLYGCDSGLLDDQRGVRQALLAAARASRLTIVETVLHRFSPQGVSGGVVIAESHLAIHTWPEHGYAALDIFTCGDQLDPRKVAECLATQFQAQEHRIRLLRRGRECNHGDTEFTEDQNGPGKNSVTSVSLW